MDRIKRLRNGLIMINALYCAMAGFRRFRSLEGLSLDQRPNSKPIITVKKKNYLLSAWGFRITVSTNIIISLEMASSALIVLADS